jgi:hypothetical protein
MAEVCLRENAVATGPYHVNPVRSQCALEQGTWQDRQLRKEAIRAYALAGRFGGVHNLWEERPGSNYGAFSDDPEGYEKLMVEAERVGIERGEPVALSGASIMLRQLGDTLAAKGDSAQAHDAYMESLAMAVGSAAGHAQYNAALAAGTRVKVAPYDPANDPKVASYPLSAADRLAAINDGLRRADAWRKQS